MKLEHFSVASKNTVSYDKMKMRMEIESRAESLDKRDSSNLSFRGDWGACDQFFPNLTDNDPEDILKDGLCFKIVANTHGKTYHPLPHWHNRNDIFHQVSCRFHHRPSIARGANASSFARKCDQEVITTTLTVSISKSFG